MYLKSLNLLGFKSFADKTTLQFQRGVAAIVGPNGCGKSNVSDAIRWVLGEQSAKALRGGAMQDVIFNGAETRKPLGLAEVSLTIGGIDKERLSVSGIDLRYNEVTITRRVYRDGGSDYYINKTKCRLRDIQQLFMGTGMGRASYSILAQGHITQLLSSKPDDRRFVFEEAAGITGFKTQKKEALRKLQHAEQNLARVQDRVNEIRRQIGSLQRQAAKARRYKETSESLRLLETQWARHRYSALTSDLSEKRALSSSSNDELQTLEGAIQSAEAHLEEKRESLIQLEARADEERRELARIEALIQEHCHRIELSDQRLQELRERNERASVDVAQAEERLESAHAEIERLHERQKETEANLEERQSDVSKAQEGVDAAQNELAEKQAALRAAENERDGLAARLSTARERLSQIEMMRQNQANALDRLESEWQEGQAELARLEAARQESATTLDKDKESIERNRETVEQRRARLRELEGELERRSNELESLSRESAELRSRYDVLEQLQNAHEGFDEGAIAALRNSEETLGALVDLIRAPDDYIQMVETALNGHLQIAIARSPEAAKAIVDSLRDENRGRACVTSTNLLNRANGRNAPSFATDWPRLIDKIDADESAAMVLEALIGNAYIAPSLADAMDAARQTEASVSFVTPEGEFLDSLGLLTGGRAGSGKSKKASSALSRKNQMLEISERLEALRVSIEEKSRQKGETQAEITEIKSRLESIESEVQTAQVSVANREGELRGLVNSVDRLRKQLDANRSNRERVQAEQTDGESKLEELSNARDELEEGLRLAKLTVESHAEDLEASRTHRDEANTTLSEARIRLNTEQNSLESLKQSLQPLEQRVVELGHQIDRNQKDMASFIERREEAKNQIEDSRSHIQELETQRESQAETVQAVGSEKHELDQAIADAESQLRETRKKLDACRQKHSGLEVELAQQTMTIEALQSRILEKYELELESIEPVEFNMSLGENGRVEIEQPDEDDPSLFTPAEIDWEQVGAGVKELQRKIDSMGPVNLVAIEEYEEAEKRHEFLSQQSDELVQARESLLEAIEKINTESSRMFSETFTQIQTNFKTLFTEVFGGGKAELRLVDEADALDSGIEIIARPPGKQLQNISLLSGGEQTMTAVALLFAIYMVRPSPFCVLDELDAPLDESNIRRFVAVLQRFIDQSQFIIITHNKRTISIADVLYGVTMQQRGISKIVSYRFKEAERADEEASQDTDATPTDDSPSNVPQDGAPPAIVAPETQHSPEALQPMSVS